MVRVHVGGGKNQPFLMKGKTNNPLFSAMIDSGSPISIFTQSDLWELLKVEVMFARKSNFEKDAMIIV